MFQTNLFGKNSKEKEEITELKKTIQLDLFQREIISKKAGYSGLSKESYLDVIQKIERDFQIDKFTKEEMEIATHIASIAINEHYNKLFIFLIENGIDINNISKSGENYFLIDACLANNEEIAKYLINNNIDFSVKNQKSFVYACKNNMFETVIMLSQKGVDINSTDVLENTAIMEACNSGNKAMVIYLIEKGARVDTINSDEENILMKVNEKIGFDIIQLLIDHGANIHAKNKHGSSVLKNACGKGQLEYVKFLIEKGLDIKAKDIYGNTTLIAAAASGEINLVKYLLELGLDPNEKNEYGENAFVFANQHGHKDVENLLSKITFKNKAIN